MRSKRGIRAVRAVLAASVSTFVALAVHVLAGGTAPSWVGVLAPLAMSALVALVLVGRNLRLWRMSAIVLSSQFLFHSLFVLGSPGRPRAAEAVGMHHDMVGTLSFAVSELTEPAMGLGHALAAAATVLALVRGERALRLLVRLVALVCRGVRWPAAIQVSIQRFARIRARLTVNRAQWRAGFRGIRGPPAGGVTPCLLSTI